MSGVAQATGYDAAVIRSIESLKDASCMADSKVKQLRNAIEITKQAKADGNPKPEFKREFFDLSRSELAIIIEAIQYFWDNYEAFPAEFWGDNKHIFSFAYQSLSEHNNIFPGLFGLSGPNNIFTSEPTLANYLHVLAEGIPPAVFILGNGCMSTPEERARLEQASRYLSENLHVLPSIIPPPLSGIPGGMGLLMVPITLQEFFTRCHDIQSRRNMPGGLYEGSISFDHLQRLEDLKMRTATSGVSLFHRGLLRLSGEAGARDVGGQMPAEDVGREQFRPTPPH